MKKIPLSQQGKNAGKYFALVDDEDYERLNKNFWQVHSTGKGIYASCKKRENGKQICYLMHRMILNCNNGEIIDHIDGNTLNNQKNNLRVCTFTQNAQNKKKQRNNKSGYKGVDVHRNKWRATIAVKRKTINIGIYKTPVAAARAYNKKALELFGEFARLNNV